MLSLTESRLQRNGAEGFSERLKEECVRHAMPFVVEAMLLWAPVAVSVVLVMYMLVRRWL
jgi:hypothetical protein